VAQGQEWRSAGETPATKLHPWRFYLVPAITFTDGAKYVADTAGAYWLLDEIALAQRFEQKVAAEEFQRVIAKFEPAQGDIGVPAQEVPLPLSLPHPEARG
jgi:hypothetical protein